MKNLTIYIAIALTALLISCSKSEKKVDHIFEHTLKITYIDSAIDTLYYKSESEEGYNNHFVLSSDKACLKLETRYHYKTIACGVRKFEILDLKKTVLHKP